MASAVVQVCFADPPSRSQWNLRHCGVLCFIKDNIQRSHYLRVFCLDRQSVVWEQELYSAFEYCAPRPYFHTFEGDDCRVGLNFANDAEAEFFLMAIKGNMRIKSEKRERRRLSQQQSQPWVKPTPVAINGSASKTTVRTTITTNSVMTKNSEKDKNKKLTKADIGLPSDFKHLSHVGWDPNQGFALDNVDPNLLSPSTLPVRNRPSKMQMARWAPPSRLIAAPSSSSSIRISFPLSIATPAVLQLAPALKMAPVTIVAPPPSPAGSPPPPPPLPPTPSLDRPFPSLRSLDLPSTPVAPVQPVRSALTDTIKEGQKIASVPVEADPSMKKDLKSSVTPDSSKGLLGQIRAGKRLKPVEKDDNQASVSDDVMEVMAGALNRVLEERCRVIHSDSEDSGQDQDDDWTD
ncbi:actin nucleation-promoting factor WAS-like [Daphnia carinata]|uniref:actin nucleation-promoting factor WAS-like n=1 Tax=Daphnia carinata TaxID=120202 RepID=UPI00257E4E3A|nr:actin nucleation-promoting factor WAS-like [Daphnia carinata]